MSRGQRSLVPQTSVGLEVFVALWWRSGRMQVFPGWPCSCVHVSPPVFSLTLCDSFLSFVQTRHVNINTFDLKRSKIILTLWFQPFVLCDVDQSHSRSCAGVVEEHVSVWGGNEAQPDASDPAWYGHVFGLSAAGTSGSWTLWSWRWCSCSSADEQDDDEEASVWTLWLWTRAKPDRARTRPPSLSCFSSSVCASWTSPLFNSFLYAPVSTSPRSGSEPRSIINERWKVSVVESSFLNFGLNSRWTPVCSVRPLTRFLWLIIIFLCGSLEDTPHCDAQYGGVAWTPAETFETWMLQVCGLCDPVTKKPKL